MATTDEHSRMERCYARIIRADYEFLGSIDTQTGLLRALGKYDDSDAVSYAEHLALRTKTLVEDEFVAPCVEALCLKTMTQQLKTQDVGSCTFPARRSLLGEDAAFQWRFGYADREKHEIILSRRALADKAHDASAEKMRAQKERDNEFLINALSSVVEFRSLESPLHIKRVRTLTEIMLRVWSALYPEDLLDDDAIRQISQAATLHDIGKVTIPNIILLKPGRLTAEEFAIVKTHTLRGCEMLEHFKEEDSRFYRYCYDICRYHHERSDGNGYPDGLREEEIPIWAQVVSVVDVFDALISPRVYKASYTMQAAAEMIENGECGVFSKKLLRCFRAAKETLMAQSEKLLP